MKIIKGGINKFIFNNYKQVVGFIKEGIYLHIISRHIQKIELNKIEKRDLIQNNNEY